MFIRRMVEYIASDSKGYVCIFDLVQNGNEFTDSINKAVNDVILRDVQFLFLFDDLAV